MHTLSFNLEPVVFLGHFVLSPRPVEVLPVTAWLLTAVTRGLCAASLSQCAADNDDTLILYTAANNSGFNSHTVVTIFHQPVNKDLTDQSS